MRKIRIGIIGAGGIAAKMHLPELAPLSDRCEIALLAGRKESRLRLLQEQVRQNQTNPARITTRYEDVVADDSVDAVIIATPHPQHVAWGLAALGAGKHAFLQKPLCGDLAEADAFVMAAANSPQTVLCLPHFSPAIYALRRRLEAGVIGQVASARARTAHGGPEVYYREVSAIFGEDSGEDDLWFFDAGQAAVGALFDMGVYAVANLVALLGSVQRVRAAVATIDKPTTLEDTAALLLEMQNGALAVAETSWCDAARTNELSVHGTLGKFIAPGLDGAEATRFYPLRWDSDSAPIASEPVPGDASRGSAHEHFLDCIERGIQPPLSHARAARHVTEILLAGLEAARTGASVTLRTTAE